jgi:predicted phosphodiesterase
MKTLLITDVHSKSPIDFIKNQQQKGIERLIFLGDVDEPKILEELISFDINKILLLGNHEYPFLYSYRNLKLHDSMKYFNYSEEKIRGKWKKWNQSDILRSYFEKKPQLFLDNSDNEENLQFKEDTDGKKIIYLHGLLCSPFTCSSRPATLFGSLKREDGNINDAILNYNFLEMKEKNYWLMFRGHDHRNDCFSIGLNNSPFVNGVWYQLNPTKKSQKIDLDENRRYLLSLGAFTHGCFGVFDSREKTIEFDSVDI